MNTMTENQVIDIDSQEVVDEILDSELLPDKSYGERIQDMERFKQIKKMVKQKRRYYKSNLFAIRKLDSTK